MNYIEQEAQLWLKAVEKVTGISGYSITQTRKRDQKIATARHIFRYLCLTQIPGATLKQVAALTVGAKNARKANHSSAIHSRDEVLAAIAIAPNGKPYQPVIHEIVDKCMTEHMLMTEGGTFFPRTYPMACWI